MGKYLIGMTIAPDQTFILGAGKLAHSEKFRNFHACWCETTGSNCGFFSAL